MWRPSAVPHWRPAGSSPQLRVTFGAGFGSPSPVIGFATFAADCADNVTREPGLLYAVNRKSAQAPNMDITVRGVGMTPPRACRGLWLIKTRRLYEALPSNCLHRSAGGSVGQWKLIEVLQSNDGRPDRETID